ncbi:MAG TPA: MFS transporter [Acidimicrobiia bacterium]|nr:MFS transporter [Acidimicrobiia bacterium]
MKRFNANYWKLWVASVTSNFGDGVATVAYPWLASAITRDGFKLGLVVLAGRLPWLLLSLPAGVITDRLDRRRLIVTMDVVRFVVTIGVGLLVLANTSGLEGASTATAALPQEDLLLMAVILASFLLGSAEVLRDNSAQTILPAIVSKAELETANGRLWGAEMVMNSFAGPPAAGFLIAVSLALPFFVDAGTFAVAAALVFLIGGEFRPVTKADTPRPSFRRQLSEGFGWLWRHPLFRPMAVILGIMNGLMTMALATYVLFVQEILDLEATAFGVLLTAGAVGGVLGSVLASRIARLLGKGTSLFVTLLGGGVALIVTGLTSSAPVVWAMFLLESFLAVLWNVITVSLRQRVIPDDLLGRVNSVYRFFGWGMMSVGALIGGGLVSVFEPMAGREWALRLPFLVAGAIHLGTWIYALPRLNSARIAEAELSGAGAEA